MATQSKQAIPATRWGDGETVLLLHGGLIANPEKTWAKQRDLADRFVLLVATRRGYGQSPTEACRTIQEGAQDVIDLMGTGAHLVGHSYGGLVALCAAAQRPDLVKSLTIAEAPTFAVARGEPMVEQLIERLTSVYRSETPEEFVRGFAKALADEDMPENLQLEPLHRKGVQATMEEAPPWEVEVPWAALAGTKFPKLVVTGGWHDTFERIATILAEKIGAKRAVVPGFGHGLQLSGQPFNDLLLDLWGAK